MSEPNHLPSHKTVIVSYRDAEYEECCECDWDRRLSQTPEELL